MTFGDQHMLTPHEIDIEASLLKDNSNGSTVWWLFDRLYIRYLRQGYRMTDARVKSGKIGGLIIGAYMATLVMLVIGFFVTGSLVCTTLVAVNVATLSAVGVIGNVRAQRRATKR